MPEVPAPVAGKSKQQLFFIWAITATLAAVVFANVALLLFVRAREVESKQKRLVRNVAEQNLANTGSPFLTLPESDVPGRYKFFENGEEMGIMVLQPDHKFINKDGTTYPTYRWEILRDGLLIVWQRSVTRFTEMEKAGVYLAHGANGRKQRIEKISE